MSDTVKYIKSILSKHARVYLESETGRSIGAKLNATYTIDDISKLCDVSIIVGGDGSFLKAGRNLSLMSNIPIIGINRGKLGFLTEIRPNQIDNRLLSILKGKYLKEKRFMLKVIINDKDKDMTLRELSF